MRHLLPLPLLALLACGGAVASPSTSSPAPSPTTTPGGDDTTFEVPDAGPDASPDGSSPIVPLPSQFTCAPQATSTLDGVSIRITGTECSFTLTQAAAGIDIPYELVVAHDIAGTTSTPGDEGHCDGPGASGLAPFPSLAGSGQSYGLYDVGGCPFFVDGGPPIVAVKAGAYTGTFHWDGRNWAGPSDTSNPEGAPFPTGTYVLTVEAKGTQDGGDAGTLPYDVKATVAIRLTP